MDHSELFRMGERFAKLRIANGFTQSQAAEAVGITETQCGKIERGKSSMRLSTAVKFAQLYGVTLDYLLLGRTSETYAKIIYELDGMPDEKQVLIYEIIERVKKFGESGHDK